MIIKFSIAMWTCFLLVSCSRHTISGSGYYGGGDGFVGQTFTLKESFEKNGAVNFNKSERESEITITASDATPSNLTQAGQGDLVTDEKVQEGKDPDEEEKITKAKIEIGIVVDDSPSLSDEDREKIANALATQLATKLKGSHWQVHITGTSKGGQQRVGLVTYQQRGNKAEAMKKAMVKTQDTKVRSKDFYNEVALYKARNLVTLRDFRKGDDVVKVFIIITDEDMQCYTGGEFTHFCAKVASSFKRDFTDPSNSAVYGIIAKGGAECGRVKEFGGQHQNKCYTTAGDCSTSRVGRFKRNSQGCNDDKDEKYNFKKDSCGQRGGHLNSCYKRPDDWNPQRQAWDNSGLFAIIADIGGDYSAILAKIGDNVQSIVEQIPIPGVPYSNSITLKHQANLIDTATIKVRANGRNIPATNYRLVGRELTITGGDMKSVWPTGSKLVVTYKLVVLNKLFDLPKCSIGKVLMNASVKVNGRGDGFTIVGNQVQMNSAPAPGSAINIVAKCLNTTYSLAQQEGALTGVSTTCENNGTVVDCVHGGERLTFTNANQIKTGDKIKTIQRVDINKAGMRIKVEQNYVVDSIVVRIGSDSCDESQLQVDDFTIDVSNNFSSCPMFNSLRQNRNQDVHFTYKVYDPQNVFSVNVPLLVGEEYTADVKVNGKSLVFEQDYVLDETEDTITFITLDVFETDSKVVVNFLPQAE